MSIRALVLAALIAILAAMPSAASADGGYTSHHSRLHCDSNKIWAIGDYMVASAARGQWVRVSTSLWRWSGTKWVRTTLGSAVFARPPGMSTQVSGDLTNWYRSDGSQDADGTSDFFTIHQRGSYWAIAEEIAWLNSAGQVVHRHYDWVYPKSGSTYYCYI